VRGSESYRHAAARDWRTSWVDAVRVAFFVAGVLLVNSVLVSAAAADFTAATLLSGTPQFQFERASAPALSADGRYAVFQGVLADIPGVYRRNLQTGAIEEVAGGDAANPSEPCNSEKDPLDACDAAAPSISANGQYIAFTTTADLQPEGSEGKPQGEPAGDKGCPEVYVRNMGTASEPLPAGTPGAYTLASALDGSSTGIKFLSCAPSAEGFAVAGAQAAPAVAISADGRHVAFTVLSTSNLTHEPGCPAQTPLAECPAETQPSQVVVRDLETDTTTLVSATPQGQPTPAGGAFPSSESEGAFLTIPTVNEYSDQATGSTAAISADASTVAWLGTNVPDQVPSATDVAERGAGLAPLQREAEPLWRRIADGPTAVTKRLLAGAGLNFYFRPAIEDNNVDGVFDGSFIGAPGAVFIPPALSENGRTVAVIANAPTPANEGSWIRGILSRPDADTYVVRVPEGSEEPQATALTVTPDYAAEGRVLRSVKDVAISPDGNRIAFDTGRSQFDLPSLAFAGPPFTNLNSNAETFEANLALGTLQRVTSTYNELEPNGEAGLLAFSATGQLAFASTATNLFFGDGVPSSQVYLTQEIPLGPSAAPQELGATPGGPMPVAEWTLSATAVGQADGSVLVQAQVPGAGRLSATARAQLPKNSRTKAAKRSRKVAGRKASASRTPRKRSGTTAVPLSTVTPGAATSVAVSSFVQLHLRVLTRYRSLIAKGLGLYALVRVTFTAPGHAPLVKEIPVTFHYVPPRIKRSSKGRVADRADVPLLTPRRDAAAR
jgi:hypothetical protein